ncbi:MAG: LemA family protein, partial [archaeon]
MESSTIAVLAGSAIVVITAGSYVYKTYNRLVNLRMDVERQTGHLQAHLKKKFDLIPALVEIVKGYATHEKGLLEEVTRLRSQWGASKTFDTKMKNANMLESALSKLMIVHERYPKIKADKGFMNIQGSIGHVERELLHERKVYNKRISYYRVKVKEFPSNIIAKMFGFNDLPFFSA